MCNGLCKLYILVFVLFSCICTECLLWIVTFSNFFPNFLGMLCNKNAENFRFWKFFFTKKVNLIPETKRSEQITKSFKQILLYMFMFCWYCFYTFTIIEKRTFRTSHNLNKYENIFGFQTLLFLWLLFFLFFFISIFILLSHHFGHSLTFYPSIKMDLSSCFSPIIYIFVFFHQFIHKSG